MSANHDCCQRKSATDFVRGQEGCLRRKLHIGTSADGRARGARARFNVGRETRRWRRDRGLTLAQVGERSGLNIGYLSQIENDKAVPSLEALAAIAAALDVPPAWLLLDGSVPAARRPRRGAAAHRTGRAAAA